MPLPRNMKIGGSGNCAYCGHRIEDAGVGAAKVYTKARAKWLEQAAVMTYEAQGDDDWLDWVETGRELTAKGE